MGSSQQKSTTLFSLPASVERIEDQAFIYTNYLRSISFSSTKEHFIKAYGAESPIYGITVHCTDGDIVI